MSNPVVAKARTFDTRTEANIPVESPLAYSYQRSGAPAPAPRAAWCCASGPCSVI